MTESGSNGTGDDREYPVGWGRPPQSSRWQKGQSGNPRGRPKQQKNASTILKEILSRTVEVRDGGRIRRITVTEAVILKIVEDALRGDTKSAAFLLSKKEELERDEPPDEDITRDMSLEEAQRIYKEMKDWVPSHVKKSRRRKR
jgi:hypothetical protein